MPYICAVYGCSSRAGRDSVSFYRFPRIISNHGDVMQKVCTEQRDRWVSRINRKDLDPNKLTHQRVCSKHFVTGKPAGVYDKHNPDWIPSLEMRGKFTDNRLNTKQLPANKQASRFERAKRRQQSRPVPRKTPPTENLQKLSMTAVVSLTGADSVTSDNGAPVSQEGEKNVCDASVQTDMTMADIFALQSDNLFCTSEICSMREKLESSNGFSEDALRKNEQKVKFYTGLPNFAMFIELFYFLVRGIDESNKLGPPESLNKFQQFCITLMRLRLALSYEDLAYRFGVSKSSVYRYFTNWLNLMHLRMTKFVKWPSRETLRSTMPRVFQERFGERVSVIVDCFEIFIERPSAYDTRSSTFSDYKHHNTAKYLIGICPQGKITFISDGWGGRTSDKHITENCGLLDKLLAGDLVMADRGFNIQDDVAIYFAEVVLPAFTRGKKQLSAL